MDWVQDLERRVASDGAALRKFLEIDLVRRRQLQHLDEFMMWAESAPEDQLDRIREAVEAFRRGYSSDQLEKEVLAIGARELVPCDRAELMRRLSSVRPVLVPDLGPDA